MVNQSPEQKARDKIDLMLAKAGWVVQDKNKINFAAAQGIAVREYQTDVGPAHYAPALSEGEILTRNHYGSHPVRKLCNGADTP